MDLTIRVAHLTQGLLLQTLMLFWTGAVFLVAAAIHLIRTGVIKPGMSEEDVREAMGRPTRVARAPARAKWIYNSRSRTRKTVVSFRAGRVSRVSSSKKKHA